MTASVDSTAHEVGNRRDAGPSVLSVLVAGLVGLPLLVAFGWGLGMVGATFGPTAMVVLPGLLGVALLAAHRPLWAVGSIPLLAAFGLEPLAGQGVQLVHALVAVTVVMVAAQVAVRPSRRPSSPLLAWAVALVLVALLSAAAADRVLRGLRVDANLILGLAAAVCVVLVVRRRVDLVLLLRASAVGSLLITVPALAQLGGLRGVYGGALVEGRLVGSFAQPNELGSYTAATLWLAVALVAVSTSRADRLLGTAAGLACFVALVFSLSRGSWFGAVAGVAAVLVLHPRAWRAVAALLVVLTVLTTAAVVATPFPEQTAVVADRLSTLGSGGQDNPADRRDLVWQEAARLISSAPVLGHGPGSFAVETTSGSSIISQYRRLHAHNVLLHTGAEIGLLGVAVLVGMTVSGALIALQVTRYLRRRRRWSDVALVAAVTAACASFVGHGLVDVTLQNPVIMIHMWFVLGLFVAATSGASTDWGDRDRSFAGDSVVAPPPTPSVPPA